jgi:hypothetical protein
VREQRTTVTVADEVGGVASAVYWTNKGAVAVGKGAHRKAQEYGMRYQNWHHKGAGEEASGVVPADAVNGIDAVKNRADRPRGKNWNTESTDEETTYYHHTKSTRKEAR